MKIEVVMVKLNSQCLNTHGRFKNIVDQVTTYNYKFSYIIWLQRDELEDGYHEQILHVLLAKLYSSSYMKS